MKLRGNDVKKKEKAIEYHPPIAPEKAIRYLMQKHYSDLQRGSQGIFVPGTVDTPSINSYERSMMKTIT